MTKADLIEKLHQSSGKSLSKKALNDLVDEVFSLVAKSVKKDKRFVYPGFGTFALKKRGARVGRSFQTGTEVRIPPSKTVSFRPAATLKNML